MKEQEIINAVKTANILEVETLIKEGTNLNFTDDFSSGIGYGWTPLHYCIFRGGTSQNKIYNEIAELLLKNGAKNNILNLDNENSVEFAIKFFAPDILDILILNGANIYGTENEVFDIILNAYYKEEELDKNHIDEIEGEVEKAAIEIGEGESLQRMFQRIDMVVKNGFDLNHGEYSAAFCTLLEIEANNLPAIVLLHLFENGANPLQVLNAGKDNEIDLFEEACYRKLPTNVLVKYAETIGVNHVFGTEAHITPLYFAVIENNVDLTNQLIKSGADIHNFNDVALRLACTKGYFEMVKCLVENGASIDIVNKKGESPIQTAEKGGFKQIVDYLESKL
jgi:Ankyrin repeats (3 copies)/Ankyrin repeat